VPGAFGLPLLRSEILPYALLLSSLYRFFPRFHCFQARLRSLRLIQEFCSSRTEGVSQNPKYPIHPRRYPFRSLIVFPGWSASASSFPNPSLNRASDFGAIRREACFALKLNPRNFRLCGGHRAFRFVHLQFELLFDEAPEALHHALPARSLSRRYAIIRVAHEAWSRRSSSGPIRSARCSTAGRKRTALRRPFSVGLTRPRSITPAFRNPRRSLSTACRISVLHQSHQLVVVDPIEEFLQVDIHHVHKPSAM